MDKVQVEGSKYRYSKDGVKVFTAEVGEILTVGEDISAGNALQGLERGLFVVPEEKRSPRARVKKVEKKSLFKAKDKKRTLRPAKKRPAKKQAD